MAEWLMRGTVNTFFRGSIPLGAFMFLYSLSSHIPPFVYFLPLLPSASLALACRTAEGYA